MKEVNFERPASLLTKSKERVKNALCYCSSVTVSVYIARELTS